MRKIILIILLLLTSVEIFGCNPLFDSIPKNSKLSKILNLPKLSKSEIEVRIFKDIATTNGGSVFILRKDYMNPWESLLYEYTFKMKKNIATNKIQSLKVTKLKFTENPDSLFKSLLSNNILILPDESIIESQKRVKIYNEVRGTIGYKKTEIIDGVGYDVEIKYKDEKLIYYTYSNPKTYLKHYPNIKELENFVTILNIIQKYFDIDF
jgi:hypothetical protein